MIRTMITAAVGLGLASILGSTIGLVIKKIPHRWNDIFLGFCSGMMLTAALVCLIVPSVDMAGGSGWWQPVSGVAAGVALIGLLDRFVPHIHRLTGLDPETHPSNGSSTGRILLFVMAIAIHKFPEGLAAGVVFDGDNMANAYAVAITIAMQNIPEGMVVVTPLLMVGVGYFRVIAVSLAVALLEVAGVVAGYFLGDISTALLPSLMALAGGAMLYVISDEMIPETHSHGFQKHATYALVAGMMSMLYIQALV